MISLPATQRSYSPTPPTYKILFDSGHPLCRKNVRNSEVCHSRCAFKVYVEVKSVKIHNYKIC